MQLLIEDGLNQGFKRRVRALHPQRKRTDSLDQRAQLCVGCGQFSKSERNIVANRAQAAIHARILASATGLYTTEAGSHSCRLWTGAPGSHRHSRGATWIEEDGRSPSFVFSLQGTQANEFKDSEWASPGAFNPSSTPAAPVRTGGTRPGGKACGGAKAWSHNQRRAVCLGRNTYLR